MAEDLGASHSKIKITDHESNVQIVKDASSNLIGTLSGDMFTMGLGLMLLDQTHSAISFGVDMLISPIVGILFLVPIGNIVDTYKHKTILIWSMIARIAAIILLGLTINLFHDSGKLIPVVLFLICDSISVNFNGTSYSASVHELVNNHSLQRLNSLTQSASSFSSIFSQMLGVVLYSVVGFEGFLVIEVISNVITLLITLTMHFHYDADMDVEKKKEEKLSSWGKFKVAMQYVNHFKLIKYFMIIGVVFNFGYTALTVGMPFMIKTRLGLGNYPVGVLSTCISVGMLVGSIFMSIIPDRKPHFFLKFVIPIYVFNLLLIALGFIFMNVHTAMTMSILGGLDVFIMAFVLLIINITAQVVMQKKVAPHLLGRVSSTLMTVNMSIMPIGILLFTFLFQTIHNGGILYVVIGIVLITYISLLLPRIPKVLENMKSIK
ncbi:MFS transporter [Philodulcilactobacillus myokoensis]|uniref:MFS transporter n=1 Tax=Philodulcilactobacillus myokoensis TaxID=2929573 RepID=A0A9W6B0C6_9LACO|nr:MFS transporter [Philodulcilactobacillus myokoensis]GLB46138.1 MFS transporter [Philodulcilactobacillus myokoensis]